jgi:hypothetical protein
VLERLDSDLAQAFVLFELEQLSKNEVARELGIPPGTAASRRRRARQTVEATMARLGQMEMSGHRSQPSPLRSASASRAKGTLVQLAVERISKVPIAELPGGSARGGPQAPGRRRIA